MKRTILILSAACLLAGCASENGNTGDEGMITEINGQSFEQNYTDKELEEIFCGFIKDYYDGTKEADFDKCFSHFPDFYMEMLEKEVGICNMTHEEYMQDILLDYKLNYGDDFDIKAEIAEDEQNIKGILCLAAESIDEMEAAIKEAYSVDVDIEEAYMIYANVTTAGSVDSYSEQMKWFLLKIGGEMYLYEIYYETNPLS